MLRRVQFTVCLIAVVALAAGLSPLWGADGEGTPLALGFVRSDGTTAIAEFTSEEYVADAILQETPYGAPPEPLGHQLVRLTNVERANNGLAPLKAASELMNSSQYHSDWMANHDCFAHNCPGEPDWVTRIVNAGYVNYEALAENIAAGYGSANDAVQAWMNSPGHRANMLAADFREAGGGYAYSASAYYHRYWTMDFGARNPVYPVVINREAWSTTSLQVQLYVYGQGWAQEMSFSNDGITWSPWESYSCNKAWTLSMQSGSPATVYAQIKRGSTTLENTDSIHLDVPLTVVPTTMVFLWAQGSPGTIPAQYKMSISAVAGWTATPNQNWIKLSQGSGTGPATVTVYVEGFPSTVGTHSGTITVESLQMVVEVQVTLVVTSEPLQKNHVPVSTKVQA
jgi:uncharacterized protein YkwD